MMEMRAWALHSLLIGEKMTNFEKLSKMVRKLSKSLFDRIVQISKEIIMPGWLTMICVPGDNFA